MARPRNHVIYSQDRDLLLRLSEEYAMLGRENRLEEGKLTVFALPRKYKRKRK